MTILEKEKDKGRKCYLIVNINY